MNCPYCQNNLSQLDSDRFRVGKILTKRVNNETLWDFVQVIRSDRPYGWIGIDVYQCDSCKKTVYLET